MAFSRYFYFGRLDLDALPFTASSVSRQMRFVRDNQDALATAEDLRAAEDSDQRCLGCHPRISTGHNYEWEADGRHHELATHNDLKPELVTELILTRLLLDEWETLPLTIVTTKPELYGEIDRFWLEAELRSALMRTANCARCCHRD